MGGGTPDGICIDIDNNLWVAEFDGMRVSKWNTETFQKMEEINFPIHVTSCCIGGKNDEYLYVTTSKPKEEKSKSGLFRIKIR